MNNRKLTTVVLMTAAVAACTDAERMPDGISAPGTTRVELRQTETRDISVYAFRQKGDVFVYDTLFRDGWAPDGRLSVRLPDGRYKFLFVSGSDENISLEPTPLTARTTWEEAVFTLRENPETDGFYFPADELFLQYPASDANRIYTLAGTDMTVPARLSRAVCQVVVHLKRGFHDGTGYVEVPYAAPHSVLDEIERIELAVTNAGLRVSPDAVSGTAAVAAALPAADHAAVTQKGFIQLDGPMLIPPADGANLEMTVRVVPAAGAALQPAELQIGGKAERNKCLDITLWITSGYPVVGVEIDLSPIDREQNGDSGIWE